MDNNPQNETYDQNQSFSLKVQEYAPDSSKNSQDVHVRYMDNSRGASERQKHR